MICAARWRFRGQIIVHAANGLNVFATFILSEYKNEPSRFPRTNRGHAGSIIHRKRAASHHVIFNLQRQSDALIKLTCFRADTGFKLRDHIVVIESAISPRARRISYRPLFLLPPVTQRRYQRRPARSLRSR